MNVDLDRRPGEGGGGQNTLAARGRSRQVATNVAFQKTVTCGLLAPQMSPFKTNFIERDPLQRPFRARHTTRPNFEGFMPLHPSSSFHVPRGPWDRKISIPIENFSPGLTCLISIENLYLDRTFQSRRVSVYGDLLVLQRRARSKIPIH